jgi:hypothetical protein
MARMRQAGRASDAALILDAESIHFQISAAVKRDPCLAVAIAEDRAIVGRGQCRVLRTA